MSSSSMLAHHAPAVVAAASRLTVTWQDPISRQIHPVGQLEVTDGRHRFRYIANVLSVPGFRPFLSFPDLRHDYESQWLFPLFAERVMDPRRPDHARYLETLELGPDASPFEVLAASSGRRLGDTIQLFPEPQVSDDGTTTCRFLVHGIRHILQVEPEAQCRLDRLQAGDQLRLIDEPSNPKNARAVLTADIDGGRLGWVPDLLLEYVHTVQTNGPVQVNVVRRNGRDAPAHMKLLAQLDGRVLAGYRPFTGPEWEPLT